MNSIRIADASDARELSEMAFRIWREYFTHIVSEKKVEYMIHKFQSETAIYEQISEQGFVYGFIMNEDSRVGYFSIHLEDDAMFVSKFYVSAESRGRGTGSSIMRTLQDHARSLGKKRMYLRVSKKNAPSIAFYEKNGFEVVREDKKDIGDGHYMDDFIMEYRI